MREWLRTRPLLRYVFAIAVSVVGVAVVIGIEPVVGYVPLLFLPCVALVEAYAGVIPALISVIICILGSFLFLGTEPAFNERIHNLTKLATFPLVAIAIVYLMESQRRHRQVLS